MSFADFHTPERVSGSHAPQITRIQFNIRLGKKEANGTTAAIPSSRLSSLLSYAKLLNQDAMRRSGSVHGYAPKYGVRFPMY